MNPIILPFFLAGAAAIAVVTKVIRPNAAKKPTPPPLEPVKQIATKTSAPAQVVAKAEAIESFLQPPAGSPWAALPASAPAKGLVLDIGPDGPKWREQPGTMDQWLKGDSSKSGFDAPAVPFLPAAPSAAAPGGGFDPFSALANFWTSPDSPPATPAAPPKAAPKAPPPAYKPAGKPKAPAAPGLSAAQKKAKSDAEYGAIADQAAADQRRKDQTPLGPPPPADETPFGPPEEGPQQRAARDLREQQGTAGFVSDLYWLATDEDDAGDVESYSLTALMGEDDDEAGAAVEEAGGSGDEALQAGLEMFSKTPVFGMLAAPVAAGKAAIDYETGHEWRGAPGAGRKKKKAAAKKHVKDCKPCQKKLAAAEKARVEAEKARVEEEAKRSAAEKRTSACSEAFVDVQSHWRAPWPVMPKKHRFAA